MQFKEWYDKVLDWWYVSWLYRAKSWTETHVAKHSSALLPPFEHSSTSRIPGLSKNWFKVNLSLHWGLGTLQWFWNGQRMKHQRKDFLSNDRSNLHGQKMKMWQNSAIQVNHHSYYFKKLNTCSIVLELLIQKFPSHAKAKSVITVTLNLHIRKEKEKEKELRCSLRCCFDV